MREVWVRHPRWSLALRGAVAAALAWVVGVLAPAPLSEYPYYAPLGAVVATAGTLARSARESLQTVGALLLGAGIALAADAVLEPSALAVALVVGVALLCAGWRVLGGTGVWVANSALFVLVLGQGQDAEYIGAFAGLVVVGAGIGIVVNLLWPPLPITPSDLALRALRASLVEQLDDLADWLDDEGPLEPDEWERRRHALYPTIEGARAAVAHSGEASRGNLRARRYGERVRTQARESAVLGAAAEVVDEVVRLLVDGERTGRDDVALGPRLRPELATALRSFADALRDPVDDTDDTDGDSADDPCAGFARSLDRLRDVVRESRERTGGDHFVAGALAVVLGRGHDVLAG
ncbi:aromatic acid exporter family protein [Isoptericola sp. NPDC056618]|uniref:FUSC family protein n=1 Tax=Isoptericola sp. NPDC056618 TaxID=3345878 RepID=UPI00367451C7